MFGPKEDIDALTRPTSRRLMFSTAAAVGGDLLGERVTSGGLARGGLSFFGSKVAEHVGGCGSCLPAFPAA